MQYVIHSLLTAMMLGSIAMWIRAVTDHRGHLRQLPENLLPQRPRRLPFWNAGDPLVMFGIMQILIVILGSISMQQGWILPKPALESPPLTTQQMVSNQYAMLWLSFAAGTFAILAMLLWLRHRKRNFPSDQTSLTEQGLGDELGLSFAWSDVVLGLKASLMILPPVLLISLLVSSLVKYEHPVLNLLAGIHSPAQLAFLFFVTALVTPLIEEFLFRVLLIGGLERLESVRSFQGADTPWQPGTYGPILISSFIFAIMHWGQGAAPIPLFFLAVALGYLYRRTGSIVAPLVVHIVLNALTLTSEIVRLNG